MPEVSVVLNTYDNVVLLPRALGSVLSQRLEGIEVLVVDDGSPTAPSAALVPQLADPRVVLVRQPNGGLSSARNLGIERATGDFVLFLDDDDELAPGGLDRLRSMIAPGVGVISGTAEVREAGVEAPTYKRPRDQGAEVDHQVACNLAGSFLIARDVLDAIGGYDPEMRCNHQRELLLRALPWCSAHDRPVLATDEVVVLIHRGSAADRPRNDPRRLQGCLELLLTKHEVRLRRNPRELAALHAAAGVAAAKAGDGRAARRHLRRSFRFGPTDPRALGRLVLAHVPLASRRAWVA